MCIISIIKLFHIHFIPNKMILLQIKIKNNKIKNKIKLNKIKN